MKARTAFRLRKLYAYCNKINKFIKPIANTIESILSSVLSKNISQVICWLALSPIVIPVEFLKVILNRKYSIWQNELTDKEYRRYRKLIK